MINCLIKIFAVCVLDPSSLYVSAEMVTPFQTVRRGPMENEGPWCGMEGWCRGPEGRVRIGFTADVSKEIIVDYGFEHKSFIQMSGDRGVEGFYISATWRPFRR